MAECRSCYIVTGMYSGYDLGARELSSHDFDPATLLPLHSCIGNNYSNSCCTIPRTAPLPLLDLHQVCICTYFRFASQYIRNYSHAAPYTQEFPVSIHKPTSLFSFKSLLNTFLSCEAYISLTWSCCLCAENTNTNQYSCDSQVEESGVQTPRPPHDL